MPTMSIITAIHLPSAQYLIDAYHSLSQQDMPAKWTWEWLIQEDGEDCNLANILPIDTRISIKRSPKGGPGPTRTSALERANGSLIKVLDADDILTTGALARDIHAMISPDIHWTVSRVLDLLPDGTTREFTDNPKPGLIERGSVVTYWRDHNYRQPSVHPATLCIDYELILALGGWMPIPNSEDTGLVLSANTVANGFFIDDVGLLYRKWPGQLTATASHNDPTERQTRARIIENRIKALTHMFTL